MIDIKKIDIHAHATPFPQYAPTSLITKHPWISAAEVVKFYDDLNIEKGVLLTLTSPEYHFEQITSAGCKYVADQYPDRFLWFCGIDPRAGGHRPDANLSHLLEHYKGLGAKGVGELTAQLPVDDPLMDNLFACCAEYDMPVTIHIAPKLGGYYGIIDDLGLPRLEKMLKKHKKLKILGHSQCFWSEISADVTNENRFINPPGKIIPGRVVELMRDYENLYCDLSAGSGMNSMRRDPEHAARFVEEFSDRILYGCDICSSPNRHQYEFNDFINGMVEKGMMSEENYCKFVRGNAVKLLKLED